MSSAGNRSGRLCPNDSGGVAESGIGTEKLRPRTTVKPRTKVARFIGVAFQKNRHDPENLDYHCHRTAPKSNYCQRPYGAVRIVSILLAYC